MSVQSIIVLIALIGMLMILITDKMRPGLTLLSVVIIFMVTGILTPKEMLEGFSNKGMVTVGLLFLISEGVRRSGALSIIVRKVLPTKKVSIRRAQMRLFPLIYSISLFINNTPLVVIFGPIIKRWAKVIQHPATKFLIPLSYVAILGGMCTLIGSSTNLVVHGMMLEAGFEGFTMFELGKVGIFVAIVGMIYLVLFSKKLLPDTREEKIEGVQLPITDLHEVEAVLGPRFPGINKTLNDFDFVRHYGAQVKELRRSGFRFGIEMNDVPLKEGDTLLLLVDDSFIPTWGESSVFMVLSNGKDNVPFYPEHKKRWLALFLLLFMVAGATIGELPAIKEKIPAGIQLDMFFFASITVVIMTWVKLFPLRHYTKFVSWDILITIACALGISKGMVNSGLADEVAGFMLRISKEYGPHALLILIFLFTNLITELITNNAAAALSFPLALSAANQLGVNPMPFFVVVCIAASASFSTPIGYQTNLIVQGIGNYKFTDFVKVGLPLNILTFIVAIVLVPLIWPF